MSKTIDNAIGTYWRHHQDAKQPYFKILSFDTESSWFSIEIIVNCVLDYTTCSFSEFIMMQQLDHISEVSENEYILGLVK